MGGKVPVKINGVDVPIEDIARAWASIDGRTDRFDAGGDSYDGYVIEATELIKRALEYAVARE